MNRLYFRSGLVDEKVVSGQELGCCLDTDVSRAVDKRGWVKINKTSRTRITAFHFVQH